MSERLELFVFKGLTRDEFRRRFEELLNRLDGTIRWDCARLHPGAVEFGNECCMVHVGNVHTVAIPAATEGRCFLFMQKLSEVIDTPLMNLRIQEGSHWDFTLYKGKDVLDDFSTLPQYWDSQDARFHEGKKGHPEVVAKVWNVPVQQFRKYMMNWGYVENDETYDIVLKGKAYDSDKYNYGDIWQMLDFLEALGGKYHYTFPIHRAEHPNDGVDYHYVNLPTVERLRETK